LSIFNQFVHTFPTLEQCMANLQQTPNRTKVLNSPKQAYFLMHLCAFSQYVIYIFLTLISKGLTLISNTSYIFCNNFKSFISNVLTRFTNSNTLFELCEKKTYKDGSIPSFHTTKNNLFKIKITVLVQCAT
jgi:hypothetical protein